MPASMCAVGGLRGQGPREKHLNNVVRSKSGICRHLMNVHILVFPWRRAWKKYGQTEGTEKERGRKEDRNQGTNGIMEQNKEDEALRYEIVKFIGVTPRSEEPMYEYI